MRENSGLLRAVAVLLKSSSDIIHAPYFLLVIFNAAENSNFNTFIRFPCLACKMMP